MYQDGYALIKKYKLSQQDDTYIFFKDDIIYIDGYSISNIIAGTSRELAKNLFNNWVQSAKTNSYGYSPSWGPRGELGPFWMAVSQLDKSLAWGIYKSIIEGELPQLLVDDLELHLNNLFKLKSFI